MDPQSRSTVKPDYHAFDDLDVSPIGRPSWVVAAIVAICRRGTSAVVAAGTLAALCFISTQACTETRGGLCVILAIAVLAVVFGIVAIVITRNDAQNEEKATDLSDEPGDEPGDQRETREPQPRGGLQSGGRDPSGLGSVPSPSDRDPEGRQASDS